jgi:hypothetical protein
MGGRGRVAAGAGTTPAARTAGGVAPTEGGGSAFADARVCACGRAIWGWQGQAPAAGVGTYVGGGGVHLRASAVESQAVAARLLFDLENAGAAAVWVQGEFPPETQVRVDIVGRV